jgi:hypothetical protein
MIVRYLEAQSMGIFQNIILPEDPGVNLACTY